MSVLSDFVIVHGIMEGSTGCAEPMHIEDGRDVSTEGANGTPIAGRRLKTKQIRPFLHIEM